MENGEDLVENLKTICSYNVLSLFFVFTLLLIYGLGKDYLLFSIYETATSLQSVGSIDSWVITFIETSSNVASIIPEILDIFWFVLTITLFFELVISSYHAKREGWFSSLGFLTFGILMFLFMTGIFSTVGDWFQLNFIDAIFGSVTYSMPLFNFYLSNLFIINTALIVICIVVNFIDLDFSSFNQRKVKESGMDEVL